VRRIGEPRVATYDFDRFPIGRVVLIKTFM